MEFGINIRNNYTNHAAVMDNNYLAQWDYDFCGQILWITKLCATNSDPDPVLVLGKLYLQNMENFTISEKNIFQPIDGSINIKQR